MKNLLLLLFAVLSFTVLGQEEQRYVYQIDTVFTTESGFTVNDPIIVINMQHIKGTSLAFDFETHADTNAIKNGVQPFYINSHVDGLAFKSYQFTPLSSYQIANYCLPTGDFTKSYINILSLMLGVSEEKISFYTFP